MAINDTLRLIVRGTVAGQLHLHTLSFRQILGTTGVEEQELIDAWQAACLTSYRGLFIAAHSPSQTIAAQHICGSVPLRATIEEAMLAGSIAGTRPTSTEQLAPWLCARVVFKTAFSGRERRGQFFLSGLEEANVQTETLHPDHVTLINGYVTTLLGAFGPAGSSTQWRLVVHSRKLASVPGVDCQDCSTLITSAQVSNVLTSQRSRRKGSGV